MRILRKLFPHIRKKIEERFVILDDLQIKYSSNALFSKKQEATMP